jgi:hypothetical protein
MLPQFNDVCQDLLTASEKWDAEQLAYNQRRPKNPVARTLHIPRRTWLHVPCRGNPESEAARRA